MWYQKFDSYMEGLGFKRSRDDHCVYIKQVENHFIYVAFHVNDMFLVGKSMDLIKEVESHLTFEFDIKNHSATHFTLGLDIKRDQASIKFWLNQSKYVETILEHFNMQGSKPLNILIPMGVKLFTKQCPKT